MTTLTVKIDNKKSEKAVKAVLDALGLSYNIQTVSSDAEPLLNKSEQRIYKNLKRSLEQIKLQEEGKLELRNAKELLNEL